MALSVNGFDLSPYVRLQPGEGFDPFDPDMLEYGLTESDGLEGPGLLSAMSGAREMVFPLHVSPTKTSDYADTKQGLHDQLRDINACLANANGTLCSWQDEGATSGTKYDVLSARFESDYSFRRSQKLWASGVLRVWTRPYGHTGTYRNLGTAVGTGVGVALAVPAGSVGGDVPARMNVGVLLGSYGHLDTVRAAGVAVVPSGYAWDVPVASIALSGAWASMTDPAGLGSVSIGLYAGASVHDPALFRDRLTVALSPATMYKGRNRILAVAKGGYYGAKLSAYNDEGVRLGACDATVVSLTGHQVMDLGVLEVEPAISQATIAFQIGFGAEGSRWDAIPSTLPAEGARINRLMILPDDAFAIMVDTDRRPVGQWRFINGTMGVDNFGNAMEASNCGFVLDAGMHTAGSNIGNVAVTHDTIENYYGEVSFQMWGRVASVSAGLEHSSVTARVVQVDATNSALVINALASMGLTTPSAGVVSLRYTPPIAEAVLRSWVGTVLATCSASIGRIASALQTRTNVFSGGASLADDYVVGFNIQEVGSYARAPRDRVVMNSDTQVAAQITTASVFTRNLTRYMRGEIPALNPTIPCNIIGFSLPFGKQPATDALGVDVQVQERWRYAR